MKREERGLGPQVSPHVEDIGRGRSEAGILSERPAPADDADRRRNREEPDGGKGRHLRPEEHVDRVVGPALGREDRPRESDDDDRRGKDAVPGIDPSHPDNVFALHVETDHADLESEDTGEQEDQKMMRDREREVGGAVVDHRVLCVSLTSKMEEWRIAGRGGKATRANRYSPPLPSRSISAIAAAGARILPSWMT